MTVDVVQRPGHAPRRLKQVKHGVKDDLYTHNYISPTWVYNNHAGSHGMTGAI